MNSPNLIVLPTPPKKKTMEEEIEDAKKELNEQTIELLEHALQRARNGDLQEVILVGLWKGGEVYTAITDTLSYTMRLGLLEETKMDLYMRASLQMVESSVPEEDE